MKANALEIILKNRELAQNVKSLPGDLLLKAVRHIGLEDSGPLLSLASTSQIEKLFELDLWKNEKPGEEEKFDPKRFRLWVEILHEAGVESLTRHLREMDEDFLALAFSSELHVFSEEDLLRHLGEGFNNQSDETDFLEKVLDQHELTEFYPYFVAGKNLEGSSVFIELLLSLSSEDSDLTNRLLEKCRFATEDSVEASGGLQGLLSKSEALESDVLQVREERRQREGYLAPAKAAAFLAWIRLMSLEELLNAESLDPISQEYFLEFYSIREASSKAERPSRAQDSDESEIGVRALVKTLQNLELLPENLPMLSSSLESVKTQFQAEIDAMSVENFEKHLRCLNYLGNVLIAGCSLGRGRFRPSDAIECVHATCNLGLEHLLTRSKDLQPGTIIENYGVIRLFQIGWRVALAVSDEACQSLIEICGNLESRKEQRNLKEIAEIRRSLELARKQKKNWMALQKARGLSRVVDAERFEFLLGLLEECPIVRNAQGNRQFISSRKQLQF